MTRTADSEFEIRDATRCTSRHGARYLSCAPIGVFHHYPRQSSATRVAKLHCVTTFVMLVDIRSRRRHRFCIP